VSLEKVIAARAAKRDDDDEVEKGDEEAGHATVELTIVTHRRVTLTPMAVEEPKNINCPPESADTFDRWQAISSTETSSMIVAEETLQEMLVMVLFTAVIETLAHTFGDPVEGLHSIVIGMEQLTSERLSPELSDVGEALVGQLLGRSATRFTTHNNPITSASVDISLFEEIQNGTDSKSKQRYYCLQQMPRNIYHRFFFRQREADSKRRYSWKSPRRNLHSFAAFLFHERGQPYRQRL
jgi:hypothetical protein